MDPRAEAKGPRLRDSQNKFAVIVGIDEWGLRALADLEGPGRHVAIQVGLQFRSRDLAVLDAVNAVGVPVQALN